jgi:hypothetical protein
MLKRESGGPAESRTPFIRVQTECIAVLLQAHC